MSPPQPSARTEGTPVNFGLNPSSALRLPAHGSSTRRRPGKRTDRFPWNACLRTWRPVTSPDPTVLTLDSSPRRNERLLVARVLEGDRIAARELYDTHVHRVFRLAFRLSGDEEQAHELVQETFIRAFGQLKNFRGDSAFGTWIHQVTVSVAANTRRRNKRHERETDFDSVEPIAASERDEIEPDLKERLHEAIDSLPEIYRTTFVMHDVEGYTHIEIAAATGVAVGTCKSRLFIARGKLRSILAPFMKE